MNRPVHAMRVFVTDYEATFRVRAPFRWHRHPGSMLHRMLKDAIDRVDKQVTARLLAPRVAAPAPHHRLKAGTAAPAALIPVVLRAGDNRRNHLVPGDSLYVRLRRLGRAESHVDRCIQDALKRLDQALVPEDVGIHGPREWPVEVAPHPTEDTRVSLRFITPGHIAWKDETGKTRVREDLPFPVLMRNVRGRLETVCALYGEFSAASSEQFLVDLDALIPRVTRTRSTLRMKEWDRDATGPDGSRDKHGMFGLLGEVEFEGPLGPFVPTLVAAREIHIGKQTSWGLGRFALTLNTEPA